MVTNAFRHFPADELGEEGVSGACLIAKTAASEDGYFPFHFGSDGVAEGIRIKTIAPYRIGRGLPGRTGVGSSEHVIDREGGGTQLRSPGSFRSAAA